MELFLKSIMLRRLISHDRNWGHEDVIRLGIIIIPGMYYIGSFVE